MSDTLDRLADRLENYYDFSCEGGPLKNCVEWQELRARAEQAEADLLALHNDIRADLSSENENVKRGYWLAALRDIRQVKLSALGNYREAEARLAAHEGSCEAVGIVNKNERLSWTFVRGRVEVMASGGTAATRFEGLLRQVCLPLLKA